MRDLTTCFSRAIEWFRRYGRNFVWRRTSNWYIVLVAEFCLVRTRASVAERFVSNLLKRYPRPEDLCRASDDELYRIFRSIGLPRRGPALRRTVCEILDRYGGAPPCSYEELLRLPGVGRYIASALLTMVCEDPRPFIDTNVARVLRRVVGNSALRSEDLESLVTGRGLDVKDLCLALIDIADAFCKPSKPRCGSCPLRECCAFYLGNAQQ